MWPGCDSVRDMQRGVCDVDVQMAVRRGWCAESAVGQEGGRMKIDAQQCRQENPAKLRALRLVATKYRREERKRCSTEANRESRNGGAWGRVEPTREPREIVR
jgi:hypothetical protein